MDQNDPTTVEPTTPPGDVPDQDTPRRLLRFRRQVAAGVYDRPEIAEALARRLLFRGDLDPRPSLPHPPPSRPPAA